MDQRLKDAAQSGDIYGLCLLIQEDATVFEEVQQVGDIRQKLKEASQAGDNDGFYRLIRENFNVLQAAQVREIDRRMKQAAQVGDIDALYALIRDDRRVLERINEEPFIDTPLHIAASAGHIEFAMEIVNLKASFARKLNQDGFSPMHLALQHNKTLMVLWLLDMDEGLLRVKGRRGMTPLHYATEQGNVSILKEFFEACPESIKDVTFEGDTAFHIAVKNNQIEAFQVLMGWLKRSIFVDAGIWEIELLNWKNKEGNTVLHIAASRNQRQVVKQLIETFVYSDIKNMNGLTAMDILQGQAQFSDRELSKMQQLPPYGFRTGTGRTENLKRKLSFIGAWAIGSARRIKRIPSERRNARLVVDALIATITYQAALSPPGGVWQGTADINSHLPNILRVDTSATITILSEANPSRYVGSSVMDSRTFLLFWFANTAVFVLTILRMMRVGVPRDRAALLTRSVMLLFSCYTFSMSVISPTKAWSNFNLILFLAVVLPFFLVRLLRCFLRGRGHMGLNSGWRRRRVHIHIREEWW
ncbi:hypothetical protein P3X46_025467 [Hevea brasiliensis]|uniref:PGG domain-containing protein n=1 Tax=Hevea brasiliensis TaxID=3981 RepID=A0ABQ9L795_HEVBR|nr:ankyrin repeat-containing protein BDA1 [Hevea brasiliensis]KAJ9160026.1 hypothetical protein P3X46_025467 [Hevea brasiliensis]